MKEKIKNFVQRYLTIKNSWISLIGTIAVFILVMVSILILILTETLGPLPSKQELLSIENPVASEVYSADSILLGRYFFQERSDVTFKDIPPSVIHAVLATEDARFYNHHGVDFKSLFRVFFKSVLLQHESSGGGSTITQQLAKNLYPRKKYILFSMVVNKFREMIIAQRMEAIYTKHDILTLYLNTIPFGDNTFGIEAASQRFFSVHTNQLTVNQAAVLIGMLKATYSFNPRIFPARALLRRNIVLNQMKKYHFLSSEKSDSLHALPIKLAYTKITHHSGLAPYFREFIRSELAEWCHTHKKPDGTSYNLYTDGLKIYTTLDSRLQQYAEEAVNYHMPVLQKKFFAQLGKSSHRSSILSEAVVKSDHYIRLQKQGYSRTEIDKIMKTPVRMSLFTWQGEREVQMSPTDSIQYYLSFLNAGILAMNPKHGNVVVWVGGINHNFFQYDHVKESTRRQVGSTFKPIVYAAALERGVKPCEFISAEKMMYTNMNEWTPENSEKNYDLKFSMEGALAYSVNTVSVKILEKAGINNTIALAKKMGIKSSLPAVPSLALGTASISMMEMVTAYSCFVNAGKSIEPYYLTSITTRRDSVLQKFVPADTPKQVLSPENAQVMVQMLKRTINEGTGASLRSTYGIQNDVAGKTGTTQSNADGWFIAMTPKLVIGAWVGSDDARIHFRSTALGQGARTALPLVGKFLQAMNRDAHFSSLSQAKFPELSPSLQDDLSCALYKQDVNFLEKIFGKKMRDHQKVFGKEKERKKGFFKKLFSREK